MMASPFKQTKLKNLGIKTPTGKFSNLPSGGVPTSGNMKAKYVSKLIKRAGPRGRIISIANIFKSVNRLSKIKDTAGFSKTEKVVVKAAKEGRKVITKASESGKKVYNKVKEKIANRSTTKKVNKAKKQVVKNKTNQRINKLTSKARTKPFDGKQYQGKPMSKRNKVFATVGLGLAGAELVKNSIDAYKKVNDPKPQFGSVNTKTTGRESEMTSPYSTKTKVTTPKNPKMTYKRPVAGEDFPKYNNSTGGEYGDSPSKKKDPMKTRYRAGPSMTGFKSNSLRKAGSFKGKNVTYKKGK
jgi:hypothetical protein